MPSKPKKVELTSEEIRLIKEDAAVLESSLSPRDMKYLRSLNRFLYNGSRNESIRSVYTYPANYMFQGVDDNRTGPLPSINIGRSMALTLQSKLIQTKGRIFFNGTNGLWDTIKTCRSAQTYFDAFIDRDELNDKVKKSVLDALIFEAGYIWVDDESKSTIRLHPWQYFADQAEVNYGKLSRVVIIQDWYPIIHLKDKLPPDSKAAKELAAKPHINGKVMRYFDLSRGIKCLFISGEFIEAVEIDYRVSPVVPFYYNDPVKGIYSNSIMDNTRMNQRMIDEILRRVRDALILSPANTIFVPLSATDSSNTSLVKTLDSIVGNVVPFNSAIGAPTISTPAPIDASYVQLMQMFKNESFDQEGISQLTAQSKVPDGIESGVALDTLQDIQSTRFQTQVDNLIQFYKNIYTTMIDVFPEDDEILPPRLNRANVKWKEIKRQRELYSLESSLASALSKDPKVKLEQIEKLQAQKILNPNQAAQLLEIPDLNSAYAVSTASYDYCRQVIERAIDEDKYDFYNVVDLNMLLSESVNTLLQLASVDEDPALLQRLVTLVNIVVAKINDVHAQQNPALPAPPPPTQPLSDQMLQGTQITGLTEILKAVKAGEIDPDMASGLITAIDPSIPQALILKMLGMPVAPPALPSNVGATAVPQVVQQN